MPIYEYVCLKCNREHEIIQKFSDRPIANCPECGGEMKKLISNTSFVLKGTGWYVTDYASKEGKKDKKSDDKPVSQESKDSSKKEKAEPASVK
jgi:putative FmdB family regulatory protein